MCVQHTNWFGKQLSCCFFREREIENENENEHEHEHEQEQEQEQGCWLL